MLYTTMRNGKAEFGLLTRNWQAFDELCFFMSRIEAQSGAGRKPEDFKRMNTVEFFTQKGLIQRYAERTKKKNVG